MKAHPPEINFPKTEESVLSLWKDRDIFGKSNSARLSPKTGEKPKYFSFYDGPPFANGLPHYGHLLGQTLKDIVPRYWNMRGFYVERRFGWDCHGLPVEYEVEKTLGLTGRKSILELGVDKFNEKCRSTVFHYADEWKKTVTRLGRWVDWNNQYRTMDLEFMESVWAVFKSLYDQGLVYQDKKIVAYSPRITAVMSNFEANQNYKDVQDPSLFVKFKLCDEDAYLLAWTTTPWTLISNLAVAVHPDFEYVKIREHQSNDILYVAEDLLATTMSAKSKDSANAFDRLETISGKKLIGRKYEPLFGFYSNHENAFQVIRGDFVTKETGTGLVQCAPAFGEEDFYACKKMGISPVDPLDDEAKFGDQFDEFSSLYIKDADKLIIKSLKERRLVFHHGTFVHSYPHCDRTQDPLIYRAMPTWYVAVEKIKEKLVANNQKIRWVPEHLRDGRMGKWLENARDWAISRNRFWGTPLPIWISDRDPSYIEVIGSKAELEKKSGVQLKDLHKHYVDHLTWTCPAGGKMRKVSEIFDCWFESGSMPYAQIHYPFENKEKFEQSFPADFIAEGQDQTRGWFYTLAILSTALFDRPAFKNVVVNGIVLANDGRKMSKRLKNYTAPDLLLEKFGSDSVRLYMVNSAVVRGEDLKFSDEGVRDITRSVLLPLWNSFSFLSTYAVADGWQPREELIQGIIPQSKNELDQWLISRLQTLQKNLHQEMEAYRLYNVVPQLLGFIEDLTNWYIRLSRRRFWGEESEASATSNPNDEAYATLYFSMLEFVKLLAPFAPFISEHIYQQLTEGMATKQESVHLCDMPKCDERFIQVELEEKMQLLRKVTNMGRSLRAKYQIKTRQVLPSLLVITRNVKDRKYIESGSELIRDELNLKLVDFSTDETKYLALSLKPNLKTLGKRLGKDLNALRAELERANQNPSVVAGWIATAESGASVSILGHALSLEDFLIDRASRDERLIASEEGVTVLLDTTLTEALIQEGIAREIVNRIQKLRKDSQLNVSDRIEVRLATDTKVAEACRLFEAYICGETLAVEFRYKTEQEAKEAKHHGEFEIDEFKATIGIDVVASINNSATH